LQKKGCADVPASDLPVPDPGSGAPERLIELRDVKKSFGNVFAVAGVSLHVDRGEVVGLLGDNGAGKSTLIKLIAGVHAPTSGDILVRGRVVRCACSNPSCGTSSWGASWRGRSDS